MPITNVHISEKASSHFRYLSLCLKTKITSREKFSIIFGVSYQDGSSCFACSSMCIDSDVVEMLLGNETSLK